MFTSLFKNEKWFAVDFSAKPEHTCSADGVPVNAQIVDQTPANDFMKADNGFPRSDISILKKTQDVSLQQSILARMVETRDSPAAEGLTDAELAARAIPRSVNTTASLRDWLARDGGSISKFVDRMIDERKAAAAAVEKPVEKPVVSINEKEVDGL